MYRIEFKIFKACIIAATPGEFPADAHYSETLSASDDAPPVYNASCCRPKTSRVFVPPISTDINGSAVS